MQPSARPQHPPQALSAQRGNLHGLFQSVIIFLLLFLKVSFHFLKEENIVENLSVGCLDEKKNWQQTLRQRGKQKRLLQQLPESLLS